MTVDIDSSIAGKPFVRIQRIVIDYPSPLTARVEVTCQRHVPLFDNKGFEPIGSQFVVVFEVPPHEMGDLFPLLDIKDGSPLGAEMSNGQLMVGIFSRIVPHIPAS